MSLCPICGQDPMLDNRAVLRALCRTHHLEAVHVNPGGRELVFRDRGRLQIVDQCSACDEHRIRKFLGEAS